MLLQKEDYPLEAKYMANPKSMMQYSYRSVFLIAEKPMDQGQAAPTSNSDTNASGERPPYSASMATAADN